MPLTSSAEQPIPLRRIAQAVKEWVDRLGAVWVEGQVIEINRRAGARTVFLTLRDKLGEVSVSVTTSPQALDAAGPLTEGTTVVARLKPSYWAPTGRLSYYCDELRAVGEGLLLARLEQTKRMLQAEGLFDPRLKKRLPFLPAAIGLITGSGSAAERDVIDNARRRWPGVTVAPAYALVQGPQAVPEILAALRRLDRDDRVDVIVIARGGGSLEDLLPFSDEALVRAVHACRTPVVSAIGHEVDSPILDLVADVRASTPTDAAKLVVPDVAEERARIAQARDRARRTVLTRIARERESLTALRSRPVMRDVATTVTIHREQVDQLRERARRSVRQHARSEVTALDHLLARVRAMSPKATLERGYAVVLDADGHLVSATGHVGAGDSLTVRVADGDLAVVVSDTDPGRNPS